MRAREGFLTVSSLLLLLLVVLVVVAIVSGSNCIIKIAVIILVLISSIKQYCVNGRSIIGSNNAYICNMYITVQRYSFFRISQFVGKLG